MNAREFKESENFIRTYSIYTYDNGWEYGWYAKDDHTVDYRIHGGMVKGRWVEDQEADIVKLTNDVFKITWTEPTRTDIALDSMPNEKKLHGMIFFPKWVEEYPEITVTLQNECIAEMEVAREKYETYPESLVPEFTTITYMSDTGISSGDVVNEAPHNRMSDDIRGGKYFDENYKRVK